MSAKRKHTHPVDLDAILPSLRDHVQQQGVVRWQELTRLGIAKPHHAEAIAQLRASGFEITPKLARVPIAKQIESALHERRQLPLKGLSKLVKGGTATEVAQVVDALVQRGRAVRLLRTKAEWLAPADTDVLSTYEVQALSRCVAEWNKQTTQVKASRKRPLAIWREDVRSLLEVLGTLDAGARTLRLGTPDAPQRLHRMVREHLNASVGLAFVPTLVEKLNMPLDQAQTLLLDEARKGHLELRPDAGSARFTAAELRAAPLGPDGSRLLWVRLIEAAP